MIGIKLTSVVLSSFELADSNPVLKEICCDFRFDGDMLYIPRERFKNADKLEELIKAGHAVIVTDEDIETIETIEDIVTIETIEDLKLLIVEDLAFQI